MRPAPAVCCDEPRLERPLGGVLGEHVEFAWEWASAGRPHHVFPCDAADLLFIEASGTLLLSGASWAPRRASLEPVKLFGVRLRVGASWRLLGVPPSSLQTPMPVSELGAAGRALASVKTARELLTRLERRAAEVSGADASLERAVQSLWCGGTLDDAMAHSGLSARTLERRFLRATGATPKRLQRLVRLCTAMAHRHEGGWSDVAAAAGYADQAHLTRECREFLGATPGELARCRHSQGVEEPKQRASGRTRKKPAEVLRGL